MIFYYEWLIIGCLDIIRGYNIRVGIFFNFFILWGDKVDYVIRDFFIYGVNVFLVLRL